MDIFHTVLAANASIKDIKDPQQRLKIIAKDLFYMAYYRLARGMLHDDRIVLALLFSKIYLKGFSMQKSLEDTASLEAEFRSLMIPYKTGLTAAGDLAVSGSLSAEHREALVHLSRLPAFKGLANSIGNNQESFFKWLETSHPEKTIPESIWTGRNQAETLKGEINLSEVNSAFERLLLVKAFRPDRFSSVAERFVTEVFGEEFMQQSERMLDLAGIVENEIKANTPILMCSVVGYDASGRVEDLAAETNKQLAAIAIGSSEGFTQAEKAINNASKNGRWVLLKNVHLAPAWLVQLEKKLHNLTCHPAFRIFLSMEISPKLPSNLLRLGRCFVFEPPPGIRANLTRTLSVIPSVRMNRAPVERSRLYFLLAWLHAMAQERLR